MGTAFQSNEKLSRVETGWPSERGFCDSLTIAASLGVILQLGHAGDMTGRPRDFANGLFKANILDIARCLPLPFSKKIIFLDFPDFLKSVFSAVAIVNSSFGN